MKKLRLLSVLMGLSVALASAANATERVRITTSLGEFVVELQRDRAPLTVENFLAYVRNGHYTNTLFHRVIANFVIQGGGVGTDYKARPTFKPIPNESGNGLKNLRGTVGLARASGPHSGDAQFYVNVADNADLDPLPTRWGYAVFGRVVEGMEVVDRISVSPTGAVGPFKQDAPLAPVIIQKIEIIPDAAPAPAPTPAPTNETPPPADSAAAPASGTSAKPSPETTPIDYPASPPPPK